MQNLTRSMMCVSGAVVLGLMSVLAAATTSADDQSHSKSESKQPSIHVKVLRSDATHSLRTRGTTSGAAKPNDEATRQGRPTKATLIEVTLDPLAASPPHRHPGPVSGYVLEGTLEFQIGDQPLRTLKPGDTFFEPAMILHRVTRNPNEQKRCRFVVTMVHPADAKHLVIPEVAAGTAAKGEQGKSDDE